MPAQAAAKEPELQESVARLCVAWWQADAPGKEALVTQTIPYLLVRALRTCEPPVAHCLPECRYRASAYPFKRCRSMHEL